MIDLFYEETALCQNAKGQKKIYYLFYVLSIILWATAALYVFLTFFSYDFDKIGEGSLFLNILFLVLPLIACVLAALFFGIIKNRFCLDYDYTFVSGSIRISKVIKEVKRRNIYKFETSAIEKIGKYGSETYNGYSSMPNVKKFIATANKTPSDGKDFYYFTVNGVEDGKLVIILECTKLFISNVMKFANKFILEKDFK